MTLSLEVCGHQSITCWWSGDTETSTWWSLSPTDWCNTDAPGLSRIYLRVPHLSGPLGDPSLPSFVQAELAISTSRSSGHACVLKPHWIHCDNTVEKKNNHVELIFISHELFILKKEELNCLPWVFMPVEVVLETVAALIGFSACKWSLIGREINAANLGLQPPNLHPRRPARDSLTTVECKQSHMALAPSTPLPPPTRP